MVLIMLIRRSCVIAKVPRYASILICFFKRTPHNHTTKALPCRNATHPSPFGNTFPSRARSSSKPHNLALLVGTTSHSSGNRNLEPDTFSSRARSTPFPCFANGRPHNLALLVGTTSHSSGNRNLEPDTFSSRARSTPFPCFANGRPHNLALLAEPFIKPNE